MELRVTDVADSDTGLVYNLVVNDEDINEEGFTEIKVGPEFMAIPQQLLPSDIKVGDMLVFERSLTSTCLSISNL